MATSERQDCDYNGRHKDKNNGGWNVRKCTVFPKTRILDIVQNKKFWPSMQILIMNQACRPMLHLYPHSSLGNWLLAVRLDDIWKNGRCAKDERKAVLFGKAEGLIRWKTAIKKESKTGHQGELKTIKTWTMSEFRNVFSCTKFLAEMFLLVMWLLCACNCASDIVVQWGMGSFRRKCIPIPPYDYCQRKKAFTELIPEIKIFCNLRIWLPEEIKIFLYILRILFSCILEDPSTIFFHECQHATIWLLSEEITFTDTRIQEMCCIFWEYLPLSIYVL